MMKKCFKILNLCSDLLDFDGTRGDMLYFISRLKACDISFEYVEHKLGEKINVMDFDFIYAGVCPQKYETLYLKHLKADVSGLQSYIESDGVMLAVEQSFLFLAQSLIYGEVETNPLNILPIKVKQLEHYAIGNILLDVDMQTFKSKINGFINTRYYYEIADNLTEIQKFGKILLGIDFLWERMFEGIQYRNFIGTQLRGPVLPRNYDLCNWLIEQMTGNALPVTSLDLDQKAKAKLTQDCENFIESGEQKKEYVYVS